YEIQGDLGRLETQVGRIRRVHEEVPGPAADPGGREVERDSARLRFFDVAARFRQDAEPVAGGGGCLGERGLRGRDDVGAGRVVEGRIVAQPPEDVRHIARSEDLLPEDTIFGGQVLDLLEADGVDLP